MQLELLLLLLLLLVLLVQCSRVELEILHSPRLQTLRVTRLFICRQFLQCPLTSQSALKNCAGKTTRRERNFPVFHLLLLQMHQWETLMRLFLRQLQVQIQLELVGSRLLQRPVLQVDLVLLQSLGNSSHQPQRVFSSLETQYFPLQILVVYFNRSNRLLCLVLQSLQQQDSVHFSLLHLQHLQLEATFCLALVVLECSNSSSSHNNRSLPLLPFLAGRSSILLLQPLQLQQLHPCSRPLHSRPLQVVDFLGLGHSTMQVGLLHFPSLQLVEVDYLTSHHRQLQQLHPLQLLSIH